MAKVLKFKEINSDVQSRLKDFEKARIKFKAEVKKAQGKKEVAAKQGKGLLKSISDFFADTPKASAQVKTK